MRNASLIIMGSESGRFGVRTQAAYAAGKSAVQYGLMQSLAQDAPRIYPRARVNAIAPGAVDTQRFKEETKQYGKEWYWRECEAT
jgi:NAD(P)-dependent dehydrogenase (short-subunit alcohol dehydrogenase family)